jgi:hypothetical protein
MLGYYQTRGDGTLSWVGGYHPGCSPEEIKAKRNARRRKLREYKRQGVRECPECGLPTYETKTLECPACFKRLTEAAEAKRQKWEDRAALQRKYRLKFGKKVTILV